MPTSARSVGSATVLIASTAADVAEALSAVARELGADVRTVSSLPGACETPGWDLVAVLEGTAGASAEALAGWKTASAPPTILWVSPSPEGTVAASALGAGADDLLRWPSSTQEIRARLRNLLRAARGLQKNELYQALSLGKAEWEKTFDTITDSISIIGPDLVIRRANRALARMVGREPRELVGARCHEALHGLEAPCPDCPVVRVFETGEATIVEAETFRTRHVFDYHAYPLSDADGRVYAALAYARDVTREEALKRGLRQSEKLMTVGQIAAGIAHEINNPLTAVSSYAQLLTLRLTDPKAIESARRIEEGIGRIHRLVQNLTSFVRPSEETFYPLDLNEIVADTLSFSRYDLTRGDVRIAQDLLTPLPKVLGAKDQLEHLLVNLLTNARDAVGGRGTIAVRTLREDSSVILQVADDGVGMQPLEVEKIFEPFYTTKTPGKGTGLGLFIAAGIAKKHRGDIAVESQPGRGSRFTVVLPAFCP